MSRLTRRHYIALGAIIHSEVDTRLALGECDDAARLTLARIAAKMAATFAQDDPGFNTAKWYVACGLEDVFSGRMGSTCKLPTVGAATG